MNAKKLSRRHHFIPQFLLRAFAKRVVGDQFYVHVFHKSRSSHEANVEDFAQERDFHETQELEEAMGKQESRLALLHRQLSTGDAGGVASEEVEGFVIHILLRTKNLRDTFESMGNAAFEELENPGPRTKAYIRRELSNEVEKRLDRRPEFRMLVDMLPLSQRAIFQTELEAKIEDACAVSFPALVSMMKNSVDLKAISRNAHNKSLHEAPWTVETAKRRFKGLVWEVFSYPESSVVFGDVGPIAMFEEAWEHAMSSNELVDVLALPIAHNKLLVGTRTRKINPDIHAINEAIVELSRDFFITARGEDELLLHLRSRIGQRSRYFGELNFDGDGDAKRKIGGGGGS